jgi:hypothetical protein
MGKDAKGSSRDLIKVLSRHSSGETKENHEKISQDSRSPGLDLNLEPTKYEAAMLTARLRRSIIIVSNSA